MNRGRDDYGFDEEQGGIIFTDVEETENGAHMDDSDYAYDNEDENYGAHTVKSKKKKKRKKKRYLLKFLILLLIAAAFFAFLRTDFFLIEKINVKNNSHYTGEQIKEIAGVKTGDNMFKFTLRSLEKKLMEDPYISSAQLKRLIPDALEITVTERSEKVVVPYEEKFIVADYSGMVLRIADKAPDLTVINNLTVKEPVPGTALVTTDDEILTDTLNLLKDIDDVGLYFKKISVSKHSVRAHIYDSLLVEGSYDSIRDNLEYLSDVVEDLHNKKITRGTIQVSGNGYCSFRPEVDTKET